MEPIVIRDSWNDIAMVTYDENEKMVGLKLSWGDDSDGCMFYHSDQARKLAEALLQAADQYDWGRNLRR